MRLPPVPLTALALASLLTLSACGSAGSANGSAVDGSSPSSADQQTDPIQAAKQKSCAAIGGSIASDGLCRGPSDKLSSSNNGTSCHYAWAGFNPDGSIAEATYNTAQIIVPGCFR